MASERIVFSGLLSKLEIHHSRHIACNLDQFFFGTYPNDPITPVEGNTISGRVVGMIGRYLVVENGGRLYGYWLSELSGYNVNLTSELRDIEAGPLQSSLF